MRRSNVSLIGCPEEDHMETKRDALLEKIMAENIPELIDHNNDYGR